MGDGTGGVSLTSWLPVTDVRGDWGIFIQGYLGACGRGGEQSVAGKGYVVFRTWLSGGMSGFQMVRYSFELFVKKLT